MCPEERAISVPATHPWFWPREPSRADVRAAEMSPRADMSAAVEAREHGCALRRHAVRFGGGTVTSHA
jgi:hypothetical protein